MIPQATSTDYMVPEVNMNKLRIASAVAALTSALAIPAWGADATNAAKDGASNIDQPVQQSGTGDGANGTGPTGSNANQAKARKHPPTSAMDSATPPDKTTNAKASTKHPPTSQMDRAAPDQKSPGSETDANSTGAGASPATPRN